MYVLNNASSDTAIDLEVTNWAYGGVENGVLTVWQWIMGLQPNYYVNFDSTPCCGGECGLHVQKSPDQSPTGAYEFTNCQITMQGGGISVAPWSGPSAAADAGEAGAPRQMEARVNEPSAEAKKQG